MRSRQHAVLLAAFLLTCAAAAAPAPPPLVVEDLGTPLRTMRRSGDFLVPKPEGRGWWFVTSYNPVRRNKLPIQIYIIDLDNKKVRMIRREPSGALCQTLGNKGIMGQDGKFYIGHYAKMGMWIFDPADGSMDYVDYPEIEDRVLPFTMRMAPNDGKIYLGTASAKAYLVEFDPTTRTFRNFGVQGPPHGAPRYIYYMAVGNDWVYSAAGKRPWYLVVANRKTGEQKVLMQDMEYLSVHGAGDRCRARVTRKAGDKTVKETYTLRDGEAFKEPPPASAPRPRPAPRPEMVLTHARPSSEGKAEIWFRLPGKEWDRVGLEGIQTVPWKTIYLKALPDGRLIGAPRAYEDIFIYDPVKAAVEIVGKSTMSVGTIECLGGKVYFCGYPGTIVHEYDPAKPWTYFTTTPTHKEPPLKSPESNPRFCARLGEIARTHHVHGSAIGADGLLYVGGHAERLHVGGGLCWWDPQRREAGGLREPFLVQDCAGLTAAQDGKTIVYSSRPVTDPAGRTPTPKEAKLFVLDVASKSISVEIAPGPELQTCGPVAAVGDRVVGIGRQDKKWLLYIVDLAEAKTLLVRDVPGRPLGLRRGPDRMIYSFIDTMLARIDPATGDIRSLGRAEPPGLFEFVRGDIYLTGYSLRRIRNVALSE